MISVQTGRWAAAVNTFPRAIAVLSNRMALAFAFAVLLFLASDNLQTYPKTWFDEGLNLLAAKTLAQTGQYGLETVDGFSAFDLGLSTGPTVLVPIALVFKAFGVGLAQARLVSVAYLLLAAGGLFLVARQFFGQGVGLVAILVVCAAGQAGPLVIGRQVLGEVPAVAFLLLGVTTLGSARRHNQDWLYLSAGLLFGLTVLSKNQLALLIPILGAVELSSRGKVSRLSLWRLALILTGAIMPTGLWYAYQLWTMGLPWFAEHLHAMSGEASASLVISPFRRTPGALGELLASGFTLWGAAGVVYAWLLALRDDWRSHPERLVLLAFTTVWLGFFLVFSIGWLRYAVPAILCSCLFAAKLVWDIAMRCSRFADARSVSLRAHIRAIVNNPLDAALLVVVASTLITGLVSNTISIQRARDMSPQDFAAMVSQSVRPGSVVESSEWEIDFLTQQSYHHPPAQVIIQSIGIVFLGRSSQLVAEYRASAAAEYLIDGPFSKLTGMYRTQLREASYTRVANAGEYDLFRHDPS